MENRVKHLEMIQGVVNRMGGNLFLLKGWSITLIVALFAVAEKSLKGISIIFSFCILFIFWVLDGYFLSMERSFRSLYDSVREKTETDFSMDYRPFQTGRNGWFRSTFSKIPIIFYGSLLLVMVILVIGEKINWIKISMEWGNSMKNSGITTSYTPSSTIVIKK